MQTHQLIPHSQFSAKQMRFLERPNQIYQM